MTIIRIAKKTQPYTMVSNDTLGAGMKTKIFDDGREYIINSTLRTDVLPMIQVYGSLEGQKIIDMLDKHPLAEQFQIDVLYSAIKKRNIRNFGALSAAELAIKLCQFIEDERKWSRYVCAD